MPYPMDLFAAEQGKIFFKIYDHQTHAFLFQQFYFEILLGNV